MSEVKRKQGKDGDQRVLSARQLRRLAETAAGYPDVRLMLTYVENAGWQLLTEEEARRQPGPHIPVNEPRTSSGASGPPPWGKMDAVVVRYNGHEHELVRRKADAVFWSPSAIEKFVLDYYRPLLEPEQWIPLYWRVHTDVGDGRTVYGIMHTYPSIETELTDETTEVMMANGEIVPGSVFIAESVMMFRQATGLF